MTSEQEALEASIRERFEAGAFADAVTLLVEGYGREVLRFLAMRLRDPELAADVFSEFTEELWKSFPSFGFRCSARVWAYTLARHSASRRLRVLGRERRRQVPISEADGLSALAAKVRTATLAELKTEVKDRVTELREQLPPDDQMLLVLRVNRKLDWREIAEVVLYDGTPLERATLDKEAARLRKRFQLVKERLRKMAIAAGLTQPATDGS